MNAPLFDALSALARRDPVRLHMPGHKGRMTGPFSQVSALDFTELPPTGNLYEGLGPVREAEALFASLGGARDALLFSCGATQGIQTMLLAGVGAGGTLILSRGCHQSVYHAMALLDIRPVFLLPPEDPDTGLTAPVTPELLARALEDHPEAAAALVTSPDYYGVRTDLAPLAALCHDRGAFLLVDQAHGAHFPFVGLPTAAQEGADLCVVSAHKTLPALGSSSVLYVGTDAPWDALTLKSLSALFATTSPSWPILASIDHARASLLSENTYPAAAALVSELRRRIPEETPFLPLTETPEAALDPCRLTVDTGSAGLSGLEADRLLRARDIFVEMADDRYLVAIVTCRDRKEDLERFLTALKQLPAGARAVPAPLPSLPVPPVRRSLRQALLGPREQTVLAHAAGRISAQTIAPYPPGIPVILPGEEITEKHIAYLQKKSYNILGNVYVVPQDKEASP